MTQSAESIADVVKRSVQGRNAAATQVQTAQYLKPLFKALRQRVSPLEA
jgi:pre-mRNA-splicing factor 18